MTRYLIRRFVLMFLALFIIASATWFLAQTLPGTPFADEKLSDTAREQLYAKYGLDDPLPVQYFRYMVSLAQGDLGNSFYFDSRPVLDIITNRLPVSVFLGLQALILGIPLGLGLGIVAALKHNSLLDSATTTASVLGFSVPSFVLAPLLQFWVAAKAGLLPIAGWEGYAYSILPSLSLSVFVIAIVARYIRSEMLEVFGQDYVTLAKSKGLSKVAVTLKHVLRNALIPVITALPALAVGLLTGSLVIETVYAVPGIGNLFVQSIQVSDYSMIMGTTLFYSLFFVVALLAQDILYGVIDPRIRVAD